MSERLSREERRGRLSLTVLVSAIVFGVLLITVCVSALIVYLLYSARLISDADARLTSGHALLFMSVVSLTIGAVLAVLASRITTRIVNSMITKMSRLASGDFKTRLSLSAPLQSIPAFVKLRDSFNKMAEELENTELLRGDFINNFSHEFKTPIVSIAGFAKVLKRGNLAEAQKAEYAAVIEEESLRLASMATNMLNLTRIESQTILTGLTEYNLSEQLRAAVLLLEQKWRRKGLELDLDFQEHTIWANEELLKQVWINLLDNAVKFSVDGGTVRVQIHEADGLLSVSVANEGPEIPPESRKKIFNKFYQADESHAAAGHGIGLAIVKRVVELHGGTVAVGTDRGETVFTVELPKRPR